MRGPLRRSWRRTLLLVPLLVALASSGCRQDVTEPSRVGEQQVAALAAPPGLAKALAAQARHTDRLLGIPGVVGTGVGLTAGGTAAVKVFTRAPGVRGVPTWLDGAPVEILVTGDVSAIPATRDAPVPGVVVSPTDYFARPVPIGVSTGNEGTCSTGTIAARVKARGKVYALSNNHVYALENRAPLGSRVLQPGRYDLNCATGADAGLGSLTQFVPIDFSSTAANVVDAAIALTNTSLLGRGTPLDGYGIPAATPVAPVLGMAVQKYGRTTRLTLGRVDVINATIPVAFKTGTTKFVKQILVAGRGPFSRNGDSGALIVTAAGRQPVALLFAGTAAGYTFANPIDEVLKAFNVAIDGT